MRRPTLSRWLRRELMALSGLQRFSLSKLAALAQSGNARLQEPLYLYCKEQGESDRLVGLIYRNDVAASYEERDLELEGADLTELALSGRASDVLPREFAKHLNSFSTDYRRVETNAESKKMRLERCRVLRLQKGVSVTELSRATGLDVGNVCAFLKNGDLGRVTLDDATAMMEHLEAL